uniref:ABC transporter ATP-binding protein n=1 Tax=Acidicaldus sp. TaxID=1872105 RepID=A0A8J4M6X2_9PROT
MGGGNDRLESLARRPIAFIFSYVRRHLLAHAVVLGAVMLAVGFSVSSQYALKHLVDTLMAHRIGAVWWAFGLLAGVIAADNLTWRLAGWVASYAFVTVTGDVRRDLFVHLTGHAPAFFAERQPGTLAGRITTTANAIFTVENLFSWNVMPPCLAVILAIGFLASVDPVMALVISVIAAGLAGLLIRLARGGAPLHHAYAAAAAAVDGELVDVINNISLVRAFSAFGRERARFARRIAGEMKARGESLRYLERLRLLHAATTALLTAGLLAWGILLWQRGQASAGDMVLVSTLGFIILHGTRDLAVALVDMVQHVARLSEALSTLLLPHELRDAADARGLAAPRGLVEFRDVAFAYPGGNPVLKDFNLRIEPGTRLGLVGRSGSGKTTVLTLLQRFRDIDGGEILIDGQNIADLTQDSLHKAISVVPQDVLMFHRSVLENIRYGQPDASDAEVVAAAEAARCHEFIIQLPEGYDTMVGDRGVKLSGGQRQRIAIARAFLRNAPVLLLDEATSALDSESEQAVQAALNHLMRGRTVIAVAHRLATLKDFDRIVVMQTGRIAQDGSPLVLEQTPGLYREMRRRQALHLVEEAA